MVVGRLSEPEKFGLQDIRYQLSLLPLYVSSGCIRVASSMTKELRVGPCLDRCRTDCHVSRPSAGSSVRTTNIVSQVNSVLRSLCLSSANVTRQRALLSKSVENIFTLRPDLDGSDERVFVSGLRTRHVNLQSLPGRWLQISSRNSESSTS